MYHYHFPKEQLAIVKGADLYYNCLAQHRVSQNSTAENAIKTHHTNLCYAFNTNAVPPLEKMPPDQTLITLISTSLPASYTSDCLLKAANADISADLTATEGHILFDEGAQCSISSFYHQKTS